MIKKKKRIVLTYGSFDLLHWGHILLLKRAKNLGDVVIVGLSTDEFNKEKNKKSYFNYAKRKMMLESIKYVDLVIEENDWEQKVKDINKYEVDIFLMGNDWKGKFDFLKELCEVIYLERTKGISTSKIKKELNKNGDGRK